jgi:B12-binding domain/radical SAM domain protein
MPEPDLVLLHAPSVYDFRQEAILYGPIADFAPAPFVFEICPLGYGLLADHLESAGYNVHILNLARRMLDDPDFDAEHAIAALNPIAFGIDFHWLSHAQGALAVAQIVQALHPDIPVILGGFAATHYHRELLSYPQVSYVLRGDSTEESLLQLMECLSLQRVPERVPGLTWRTSSGYVVENPPGPPLASLDELSSNGSLSFYQQDNPVAVGLMARGCAHNCITCGGSAYAYHHLHGREAPGYRSPELLARDLQAACRHNGVAYVPCDITQPGMDYAYRFLQAIRGFPNLLCLDLLRPLPRKFLQDLVKAVPHLALQFFMDSHDPRVRQAAGKHYSNQAVEQTIADALALGCEHFNLHFTIGLPYQDHASVMNTLAYCDSLLARFGERGRLQPFIIPLVPFLDPGSLAFQEPERVGYRRLFGSLEEHRRALLAPSWEYVLNYETEWMTRADIVRTTYDATVAMARLRAKHGLVPAEVADELEAVVAQTRELMAQIDQVLAAHDTDRLQDTLRALKPDIDAVNRAGSWSNRPVAARARQARQPVDSGPGGALRATQRVWGLFRDWWRRDMNDKQEVRYG